MRSIASFFFCFSALVGCAQNIKGFVYDENRQPIAGASVYLDETSIWTMTDEIGNFELKTSGKVNTALVVSYLGYEVFILKDPFQEAPHHIELIPKATPLNEVSIVSKQLFTRAEKLRVFTEQFLGTTIAGKSCTILNESDLSLIYDPDRRRLSVSADQPIHIQNNHLGYEIEYRIKQCFIDFNGKTIDSDAVSTWSFVGSTFFKDLTTPYKSYSAQRKMSYAGSSMQFFRNLIGKQLNQSGFKILKYNRLCEPDKYFSINRQQGYCEVVIMDEKNANVPQFESVFTLAYPGKPDSSITFTAPSFTVDYFGNLDTYDAIRFAGNISKNRIGDLLPLDYK